MEEKYDTALLGILQNEGKVEKFLNVILGFLYRRTDFYRLMKSKEDRLGFPPGIALKMLTSIFEQYDAATRRDDEVRDAKKVEQKRNIPSQIKPLVEQQRANTGNQQASNTERLTTQPPTDQSQGDSATQQAESVAKQNNSNGANSDSINNEQKREANKIDNLKSDPNQSKSKSEEDDDPELTRQQQMFQNNPESYNGAVRDNYRWAQSITDLDLRVTVPSYIRKGRDVKVDISKKHVKVAHKDENGQFKVVIDGDLTWEVQKDESMWTLNPGENVHVSISEVIDLMEHQITEQTCTKGTLSSSTSNSVVLELKKPLFLPTANEQKMQDMLKNAWDAEGSPFKGQPFDPSKFSMDESGVVNMKPS
ncbi:nudC domain-containing protein 3-like [Ruditapes philippinarum]|uniref:nudC domain-containing protein 3-like n=1 Tax=Ruditapes philippinarum TaxID=129788 RepID=UPI00295B27ED|nr:nudC domain-containing protein 3-like [Ruditapes philippinarum]